MPITFGELVQEVINEVRAREQIQQIAQQQAARIKELEVEVENLKKSNVREPDKKPVLQALPQKEVK